MLMLIIAIIFIFSVYNLAVAKDEEDDRIRADIRHRELMEAYRESERESRKAREESEQNRQRVTRRRAVTDSNGNTIYEEVSIEGDFNDY